MRSQETQRWICQVPSLPDREPQKLAFKSICLRFPFWLNGGEMGFATLCVCSLSRLWVEREISWNWCHKVSLVNNCVVDVENLGCGGNDLRWGFYAVGWNRLGGDGNHG